MRDRLVKICDSFNGSRFDLPSQSDLSEIQRKIIELNRKIDDSSALLTTTGMRLKDFLKDIQKISQQEGLDSGMSLLELYKLFVAKERLLFSNLNKLKCGDKLCIGYCWIPRCSSVETF